MRVGGFNAARGLISRDIANMKMILKIKIDIFSYYIVFQPISTIIINETNFM